MKLYIKDAIDKYSKRNPIRLHMLGHKSRDYGCLCEDVTELPVIDNEKAVRLAERDIKDILKVKASFILTNGSTSGIFAMISAVKGFGDKIIVNRFAHKSVFNALSLFNIEPVFVADKIIDGLPSLPTEEEISLAIENNPTVIGAILTYPDYYGRAFDIEKIKIALKKKNKLLLVDGAHGAHFFITNPDKYAGKFADIYVDGAHKTLPTLTQGAILSVTDIDLIDKVKSSLDLLLTTSPSYPILSSVEYGVKYLYKYGAKQYLLQQKYLKRIKDKLSAEKIGFLQLSDGLKLTVDFLNSGIPVKKAISVLEKNGVYAETYDSRYVLFMFSVLNKKEDYDALYNAIKEITQLKRQKIKSGFYFDGKRERKVSFNKVGEYDFECVDAENAKGRISAVNFGIFPPCYPLVVAGEVITEKDIEIIKNAENTFGTLNGKIKVVKL